MLTAAREVGDEKEAAKSFSEIQSEGGVSDDPEWQDAGGAGGAVWRSFESDSGLAV